jgi:hypothetical protein
MQFNLPMTNTALTSPYPGSGASIGSGALTTETAFAWTHTGDPFGRVTTAKSALFCKRLTNSCGASPVINAPTVGPNVGVRADIMGVGAGNQCNTFIGDIDLLAG